jgi:hypothetical protein
VLILLLVCLAPVRARDALLEPLTVCEVLKDLAQYNGKLVAVIGRFSFRQTGRWLGEQRCAQKFVTGDQEWPNSFWVSYDAQTAPKPPAVLQVDARILAQKLSAVRQRSSLGNFHFGSPDYDNWALVYGRLETRQDLVTATAAGMRRNGFGYGESSPARLVCHGDAEVVFLNEDSTTPVSR